MPGDISGLAETNMIKNQLDTGDIEMPTISTAVQDSGAIDVTLEENERDENGETEVRDGIRTDAPAIFIIVAKQDTRATEPAPDESEKHARDSKPTEVPVGNRIEARLENEKNRMPTIVAAVHDSSNKCHQGTQTELSTIPSMAETVANEPMKQTLF